ncbi:MAG: histidine kinase [Flavobacteriaceae bacterium]|nr:histidine kinase [Flavobacteriaceae bacterium]
MNKKWIEISLNILFWVFSSWLIIYSFSITEHLVEINEGVVSGNTEHSEDLIIFFGLGQPFFALYFYIQFFFIQQLTDKSKALKILLKLLLTAILFLCCYIIVVKLFFTSYIFIVWFPSLWYGIFIFYTIVAIAYGLIKAWSNMEVDKRNLEVINKQTELNLLRSQLHPHFLFNTMNNLLAMVDQVKSPKLAKSIDTLSGLLRYVVYENKSGLVSVKKEIQFIQDFSELHLLRFEEDEIDFELNVTGEFDTQLIEMGILLSFIENAFKHGVQPEFSSFIHVDIDITKPTQFIFNIKNSIPPKIEFETIGGYGLKSTNERLQLAYPNKHILEIKEEQNIYNVSLIINTDEGNNS